MINYINIHKKRLCGRNNNVVNPLAIEYDVVAQLDFQFIDSNNQIQTLPSDLSGMALAIGMKQSYPSYDLLALSKDYSISGNVISFNVNTYTQNWLNTIKKPNTEVFIEMSQKDLNNKKVWMRDTCLVWPRTYTEGLTPAEIDSNNYYTKTEVDEKIAGLDFAKKEYVDAQDAYLSGQIDLKASQTSLTAHTSDTDIHTTLLEKAAWTAKQNAITADNKLDYALISGHPEIPTKTSDLENDSDFQTSTQVATAITTATSGKADKTYVDSQDSALQNAIDTKQNIINSSNKLDYAYISGHPAIPTKTSDLENDSDFVNTTYVTNAISGKADTSTVTAHTSDTTIHVTSEDKAAWTAKADVEDIPLSTSQLTNDSDFQTSNNVQEAITTSIADKADMSYVDSQDAGLQAQIDEKQNVINNDNKLDYSLLSSTPTIPLSTSQLTNDSNYQNAAQVNTAVDTATSGKADITALTGIMVAIDKSLVTPLSSSINIVRGPDDDYHTQIRQFEEEIRLQAWEGEQSDIFGKTGLCIGAWGGFDIIRDYNSYPLNAPSGLATTDWVSGQVSEQVSVLNDIFTSRELLNEPLCFEPIDKSSQTIFQISLGSYTKDTIDIEYSLDKVTWIKPDFNGTNFLLVLAVGTEQKVYLRGNDAYPYNYLANNKGYTPSIVNGKPYKVSGNINSLIRKKAFNIIDTINGIRGFSATWWSNTNLVDAGDLLLPATTLSLGCYSNMFRQCTSLTAAPKLPALAMAELCYYGMFQGCTALTTAPAIAAEMFKNMNSCASNMFNGCTSLNSIEVNFTDWGMCNSWVTNVAATGTFTKPTELSEKYGDSNIPNGWTVINK